MTLDRILADLRAERDRIDQAISALEGRGASHKGRAPGRRRRRHMSADARRRISEMMKKRWAERKKRARAA